MPTLHNFSPLSLLLHLHCTAPSSSCFSLPTLLTCCSCSRRWAVILEGEEEARAVKPENLILRMHKV